MPLQYPLLFPYGTDGWTLDIPKVGSTSTSRATVTLRQFLAFRIQDRNERDNFVEGDTLIESGSLLQQFDVDGFAAMEQNRLLYVKRNQGKLRTDLYRGLQDAITVGDVNASAIGCRYILPSSFTGGPRNMIQHYLDAMAVVRELGPPDYFITFTCNPKWPEIVNELSSHVGRCAEDRPDIVVRVFKLKLKEFLRDFKERHRYGKVIPDLHVIEFQKRCLPHAHVLFTLAAEDKPTCPEDIDAFICAEIPDKNDDPLAFDVVTKNMIHGPCGPCLVDGKCSKGYPKKFCNDTTFDDNGFVQFRRRQNAEPIIVNGREIDNRWVVPYNRDLCVKYNAHINVERVAARSVVKYLYKYVHKGHDRATFVIEDNAPRPGIEGGHIHNVDEIQQYLDCRYVSATEACWRIFEFDLQHQYPSAELLQFHLPGEQFVVFNDDDDLHAVLHQPRLFIDPDIERTDDLHGWYAEYGYVQKQLSWAQKRANGIFQMDLLINAKRINLQQYSVVPNVKYFRVRAIVLSIDTTVPLWYESCQRHFTRADRCLKCRYSCNYTVPRLRVPVKICDNLGTLSLTLFGYDAEKIIGCQASYIKEFDNNEFGDVILKDYLEERLMSTFVFILHVPKKEIDEVRVATVLPVKWKEEYYYLQQDIRKVDAST